MISKRIDNAALFAMFSTLADNKQAIGRRYAYWCNGAPALEAAVAAAAMTQDELGHARTLYPLLEDFTQAEAALEQVEPMTRTLRYHLAVLDEDFASWCDFVATNFLVDTALTIFFEAARDSSYDPLRQRARKIIQEEELHFIHGEGWVRRLAQAGGAVRKTLLASLQRFWDETLCWFGPADDPTILQLQREGIINAAPDELRSRYLQKIIPVLRSLDLDSAFPVSFNATSKAWDLAQALPWTRWRAESRRLT
ncbi:MAG TPA: Phenylacetic acid catabolic protein [Ktedonobacteraceae bacterium]